MKHALNLMGEQPALELDDLARGAGRFDFVGDTLAGSVGTPAARLDRGTESVGIDADDLADSFIADPARVVAPPPVRFEHPDEILPQPLAVVPVVTLADEAESSPACQVVAGPRDQYERVGKDHRGEFALARQLFESAWMARFLVLNVRDE